MDILSGASANLFLFCWKVFVKGCNDKDLQVCFTDKVGVKCCREGK